jgi:hypothetical protein
MSKREKRENAKYVETRNPRDMRVHELRTVWDRGMCAICEMRENTRNLKCEMHEMRGNAKHAKNTKMRKRAIYAKVRNARKRENHEGRRASTGPV